MFGYYNQINNYNISNKMKRIIHPLNLEKYKVISSPKQCLNQLKQELFERGLSKLSLKLIVNYSKQKYIHFLCSQEDCPWNLQYQKIISQQNDYQIIKYTLVRQLAFHMHQIESNKGEIQSRDNKKKQKSKSLLEIKKGTDQIMHDERAFGFLNRLIGFTYQQIGKYYAYLDDSICTTYLITRISYQLRKMMADPNKFTFQHWLQAYKGQINYISDFKDYQYQEKVIPNFFFLTTPSWKKIYEQRGQILGIKTFQNRIIQQIQGVDYSCCLFYGILPNLQLVIFAFCVYKSEFKVVTHKFYEVLSGQQQNDRQFKIHQKIDIGFYKTLRVFFQYMGYSCVTIVTEHHRTIFDTVFYFLEKQQITNKINYVIDPSDYIRQHLPKNLWKIAIQLIQLMTKNKNDINSLRKWLQNNENISQSDIISLQKFQTFCEQYPIFGHENPTFIGQWFQRYQNANEQEGPMLNIRYLLNKIQWKMYKRTIAGILDTVFFIGNKVYKIYEISLTSLYSSDYMRIQTSTCYSQAFPSHLETKINQQPQFIEWVKDIRKRLYRQGFGLVMQQVSRAGQSDILTLKQTDNSNEDRYPRKILFEDFIDQQTYQCYIIDKNQKQMKYLQPQKQVKYRCSCNQNILKGVPCKHICKLCKFYDLDIAEYISSYWKLSYSYDEVQQMRIIRTGIHPKKRGKPKSTHTNKLK